MRRVRGVHCEKGCLGMSTQKTVDELEKGLREIASMCGWTDAQIDQPGFRLVESIKTRVAWLQERAASVPQYDEELALAREMISKLKAQAECQVCHGTKTVDAPWPETGTIACPNCK